MSVVATNNRQRIFDNFCHSLGIEGENLRRKDLSLLPITLTSEQEERIKAWPNSILKKTRINQAVITKIEASEVLYKKKHTGHVKVVWRQGESGMALYFTMKYFVHTMIGGMK